MYHDGEWGTICGKTSWSLEGAKVVCQELGFKKAIYESRKALHGQGAGKVWLSDVKCAGNESSLLECPHGVWGNVGDCGHDEDAGVSCIEEGTWVQSVSVCMEGTWGQSVSVCGRYMGSE